jgi:hypothetical protein
MTAGETGVAELAEAMGWEWTVSCTRLNTGRERGVRRIAGTRRWADGGRRARAALASTSSRPRGNVRETPSLSTAAMFSAAVLALWGADPLGPRTPAASAIAAVAARSPDATGHAPPAERGSHPPARQRGGIAARGGRDLNRVRHRRLHRVVDRGRALAPEVRSARWRLGSGDANARSPLANGNNAAERHKLLARTEPVAGEAHDLVGRLSRLSSLGLATVLHSDAQPLQVFLREGGHAVLVTRYYNADLVPVGLN